MNNVTRKAKALVEALVEAVKPVAPPDLADTYESAFTQPDHSIDRDVRKFQLSLAELKKSPDPATAGAAIEVARLYAIAQEILGGEHLEDLGRQDQKRVNKLALLAGAQFS